MDQWISFLQDRWLLLLAAVIILIIVINIVKTVLKWVIVFAVIAGVVIYGVQYTDTLTTVGTSVVNEIKSQAVKALGDDLKDAKYVANKDGSFEVSTKNLKIEGKAGSNELQVTFLGQTFKMEADTAVKALIEQAQANAK
ncbi:hypothetical protein NV379_21835 [Paenibacillus sp. N1-5-1-14]|uniref:hypothetical protein n=1 Tax=Paenibacillus radicibacter TaxID=2972488 RepID=UPI002158B505|nr:hypothetical protein [Paenibacillus radicibacter]MCR8645302.1 hypothetical protein [Paenibacillus radicibacter]